MKYVLNDKLIKRIMSLISKNETSGQFFSYDIDHSEENTLVLHQKETDFIISMKMDLQDEQLLVKSFILKDNKQLEAKSLALYDAAMIEIMIQGLDVLFHLGEEQDVEDIKFVLDQEEALYLSSFSCFFQSLPSQGRKVAMLLPTDQATYDDFLHKTESIHTKVQHALWQRQKKDLLLMNYLQGTQKDKRFLIYTPEPKDDSFFVERKVIAFPSKFQNASIEKSI